MYCDEFFIAFYWFHSHLGISFTDRVTGGGGVGGGEGDDIKRENSAHSCDPTPIDSTSSRLIFHLPSAEGCGATGIPTWHLLLYITLAYLDTKSFSLNPSVNQPDPLWEGLRQTFMGGAEASQAPGRKRRQPRQLGGGGP